jgi:hypothetical protein
MLPAIAWLGTCLIVPKNPCALAARLRLFLRTLGIEMVFGREGRLGTRIITVTTRGEYRQDRQPRQRQWTCGRPKRSSGRTGTAALIPQMMLTVLTQLRIALGKPSCLELAHSKRYCGEVRPPDRATSRLDKWRFQSRPFPRSCGSQFKGQSLPRAPYKSKSGGWVMPHHKLDRRYSPRSRKRTN